MIFVLVDDLRFDAMGFLTPGLKTPNIDFMAKHGVYFPNAVVTSSLCSPSRATILTGQTTRNHGVVDNNNSSEDGLIFFPKYLQDAGYQTAFLGKWHMGQASAAPRPGFDHWVSFLGQGTYLPTDYLSPAEIAAGKRQMLNVDGKETPQKGYITDELTDYAIDWLDKGRDRSKPFFLYLSTRPSIPTPVGRTATPASTRTWTSSCRPAARTRRRTTPASPGGCRTNATAGMASTSPTTATRRSGRPSATTTAR
jgi:arylsulfatase A-like enzyme